MELFLTGNFRDVQERLEQLIVVSAKVDEYNVALSHGLAIVNKSAV